MSEARQDPWGDMPRWSDGEEATDGMTIEALPDAPARASTPADQSASDATTSASGGASGGAREPDSCPWCATPAAEGATRCPTCGAALAQRESIGDLVIPGLTAVDPALKDLDGRPLHLRGPSPSQGIASGFIVAAAAGGPVGLAILGGVGAIAATEYLGAGGKDGKGHEHVGETSGAVIQAIERLERGEALPSATDETPHPDAAARPRPDPHQEDSTDDRS